MSDIKINDSAIKIQPLNQEAKLEQTLNRSGNFQGQNVNAALPPTESPLLDGNIKKSLSASVAQPPVESPFATDSSNIKTKGYSFNSETNKVQSAPTNEELLDFALNNTNSSKISKYLEQDIAANKAVAAIRRGQSEIQSNQNPELSSNTEINLANLANKIFRQ